MQNAGGAQARYNDGPGQVGEWFDAGQAAGTEIRATLTNLLPNRGVDVRVAAVNPAGSGRYSDYVRCTTLPRGATLVYVSDFVADAALVQWINADGADGRYFYHIFPFYRDGQAVRPQQATITSQGPYDKWLVTGLARGTTYFFKVRAV
jgi:hypothetical protein